MIAINNSGDARNSLQRRINNADDTVNKAGEAVYKVKRTTNNVQTRANNADNAKNKRKRRQTTPVTQATNGRERADNTGNAIKKLKRSIGTCNCLRKKIRPYKN